MKAHIINIGDELLIGQTINTNAGKMGELLDLSGIAVAESIAIADSKEAILNALLHASSKADVVLITGGLGPTKDDITKHVLCNYFDTELELNEEVYNRIKTYFDTRGLKMIPVNKDQAMLPKKCDVLINQKGTASGMWFEKEGVIYISMPGVPYEMDYLMKYEVIPRLDKINQYNIYHQTVKCIGIGESYLAEIIEEWEQQLLEDNMKLAYLPSPGIVKLRISSFDKNQALNIKKVTQYIDELKLLIPEYIFGYNADELNKLVGELLLKSGKTIGVCESCTGGYLSHLITAVSGCSAYFNGSIVSYSYELKQKLLNVSDATLTKYGAVSEEVVKEMLLGGLATLGVDYAIAISGVAGPTGGTEQKPVGMVCIAVGNNKTVKTFTFKFGKSRKRNIEISALYGLNELRKFLLA